MLEWGMLLTQLMRDVNVGCFVCVFVCASFVCVYACVCACSFPVCACSFPVCACLLACFSFSCGVCPCVHLLLFFFKYIRRLLASTHLFTPTLFMQHSTLMDITTQ